MTTDQQLINSLYKRFNRRPASLDGRNLRLLADFIVDERGIMLEDDRLVFTEAGAESPFREILLENIHGVADVGRLIAIVLNSSIIFFHKETHAISVHLRPLSAWQRVISRLRCCRR